MLKRVFYWKLKELLITYNNILICFNLFKYSTPQTFFVFIKHDNQDTDLVIFEIFLMIYPLTYITLT